MSNGTIALSRFGAMLNEMAAWNEDNYVRDLRGRFTSKDGGSETPQSHSTRFKAWAPDFANTERNPETNQMPRAKSTSPRAIKAAETRARNAAAREAAAKVSGQVRGANAAAIVAAAKRAPEPDPLRNLPSAIHRAEDMAIRTFKDGEGPRAPSVEPLIKGIEDVFAKMRKTNDADYAANKEYNASMVSGAPNDADIQAAQDTEAEYKTYAAALEAVHMDIMGKLPVFDAPKEDDFRAEVLDTLETKYRDELTAAEKQDAKPGRAEAITLARTKLNIIVSDGDFADNVRDHFAPDSIADSHKEKASDFNVGGSDESDEAVDQTFAAYRDMNDYRISPSQMRDDGWNVRVEAGQVFDTKGKAIGATGVAENDANLDAFTGLVADRTHDDGSRTEIEVGIKHPDGDIRRDYSKGMRFKWTNYRQDGTMGDFGFEDSLRDSIAKSGPKRKTIGESALARFGGLMEAWNESDYERDAAGRFAPKGGGARIGDEVSTRFGRGRVAGRTTEGDVFVNHGGPLGSEKMLTDDEVRPASAGVRVGDEVSTRFGRGRVTGRTTEDDVFVNQGGPLGSEKMLSQDEVRPADTKWTKWTTVKSGEGPGPGPTSDPWKRTPDPMSPSVFGSESERGKIVGKTTDGDVFVSTGGPLGTEKVMASDEVRPAGLTPEREAELDRLAKQRAKLPSDAERREIIRTARKRAVASYRPDMTEGQVALARFASLMECDDDGECATCAAKKKKGRKMVDVPEPPTGPIASVMEAFRAAPAEGEEKEMLVDTPPEDDDAAINQAAAEESEPTATTKAEYRAASLRRAEKLKKLRARRDPEGIEAEADETAPGHEATETGTVPEAAAMPVKLAARKPY